jgi:hypothetical protein
MYRDRLLNVARCLRESPNPEQFTMDNYGADCGTPFCAIGHYAARSDLQDSFRLSEDGYLETARGAATFYDESVVLDHFGISMDHAERLFGPGGCGHAKTAEEAAQYIERFVAVLDKLTPAEREFLGI